jgi:nickel-type superoxide dismutase maturation protease
MPEPTDRTTAPSSEGVPSRFRRVSSRRVRVEDESMLPTLRPGDRLLVDPRVYRDRLPLAGEIVILIDPRDPDRWLVKRVTAVDRAAATVEVRGDATATARDSREFGPVPLRSVVGHAYRIYFPSARRRNL